MGVYQILCLVGVPTITTVVMSIMVANVQRTVKENKAVKSALQAILRQQLINEYKKASKKGFADIDTRDSVQNMFLNYEALGENGVISDLHDKFLKLPTESEDLQND